jgi:hypothetical protein
LRLPKFHSWVCHTITSITEYGAINNFTTETYETLHKEWVKNPYRMSNKRDATSQMLRTVNRKVIFVVILYDYWLVLQCIIISINSTIIVIYLGTKTGYN